MSLAGGAMTSPGFALELLGEDALLLDSERDVDLLRLIADLTATGVGVEGVRRILALENQVAALQQRNSELWEELEATREALRRSRASRRGSSQPLALPPTSRALAIQRAQGGPSGPRPRR